MSHTNRRIVNDIHDFHSDLMIKVEVEYAVRDMVSCVDCWFQEFTNKENLACVTKQQNQIKWLLDLSRTMITEMAESENIVSRNKKVAAGLRENVVEAIGNVLRDSSNVEAFHKTIASLEEKLQQTAKELEIYRSREESSKGKKIAKSSKLPLASLYDIVGDNVILDVFSKLETKDIICFSECSRYMFKRVDTLFASESQLALESWSTKPPRPVAVPHNHNEQSPEAATMALSSHSGVLASPGDVAAASTVPPAPAAATATSQPSVSTQAVPGTQPITGATAGASGTASTTAAPSFMTKEVVEGLSRKLAPAELKAIKSMTEHMKLQAQQLKQITADREDGKAKLQSAEEVRNFLVEKLRSAELALRAAMNECASVKTQCTADHEVITFLDLKGQELEGRNADLLQQNEQLQAALDLLTNSSTAVESQLTAELTACKIKLEKDEIASKADKKTLAKEVKSLRSKLESTTSERNLFRAKLDILRTALAQVNLLPVTSSASTSSITLANNRQQSSTGQMSLASSASGQVGNYDGLGVGTAQSINRSLNVSTTPQQQLISSSYNDCINTNDNSRNTNTSSGGGGLVSKPKKPLF